MATLTSVSFAQEANDDCANAVEILIDLDVPYSTVGATSSGPAVTGCGGFTPPENDSIPADIWFIWTATEDGTYSWNNCGSGFDSRMAVYLGTDACAVTNDDLVNCNDDGAAALCPDSGSDLTFLATAGSTYVLRLGGFANEETPIATGMGTVRLVRLNVPDNDACQNAIPVGLGVTEFSNSTATVDGPDHPGNDICFGFGFPGMDADIWYTYTPDFTGSVKWDLCGTINFDSRVAVYQPGSNCPPAPEDLYSCNDVGMGDNCPAGEFNSQLFFDVEEGQTYLLRLGGYAVSGTGLGTFSLTNEAPPEPPANDSCANAIETQIITPQEADDFDFVEIGTTIGATVPDNFVFPRCANPTGEWGDVWYSVQTQGNDTLQLRVFSDGDDPATVLYVDAFASCMQDTIAGDTSFCYRIDDEENLGRVSTITGLPSGENITIYIRVASFVTFFQPGTFGLQIVSQISTSTRDALRVNDLKLYPNPASEQITVSMNLPEATNLEAQVFDLLGRNVVSNRLGNLPGGDQQFTLNTSDLSPGVYSLRLTDGRASQSLKFVIN